jgi:hypothetical protein
LYNNTENQDRVMFASSMWSQSRCDLGSLLGSWNPWRLVWEQAISRAKKKPLAFVSNCPPSKVEIWVAVSNNGSIITVPGYRAQPQPTSTWRFASSTTP